MKAPDFYLNNYIADELRAAFDKEDVCISYSGDYEPETLKIWFIIPAKFFL